MSIDKLWYKSIVSSDSKLHKIISNGMIQQWEFNEWVEAAEKVYISTERVEDVPKIRNKSTLFILINKSVIFIKFNGKLSFLLSFTSR